MPDVNLISTDADQAAEASFARGEVLFDIKDLEVYFPIQQGFFKAMVATRRST